MRKTFAIGVCVIALALWVAAQASGNQAERITNGPVVEAVTPTSATIAWSTNTGGSSVVKYGTDPNSLNQTAQEPYVHGGGTHRVELKGLKPGTTYNYQVISAHGQGTGTQAMSPMGQFTTSGTGKGQTAGESSGTKVPLYRAYNASTGSHLFTHNASEERNAVSNLGYRSEGIAGYIMNKQAPGAQPLYRMVGPNGDHFYTSNENEKNQAAAQGYRDEGIAGYIASSPQPDTVPLYRLVNPKTGEHFYTTNPSEHQQDLSQGWRDEGIVGYVWSS